MTDWQLMSHDSLMTDDWLISVCFAKLKTDKIKKIDPINSGYKNKNNTNREAKASSVQLKLKLGKALWHHYVLQWHLIDITDSAELLSSGGLFQSLRAQTVIALSPSVFSQAFGADKRPPPEDLKVRTGTYNTEVRF